MRYNIRFRLQKVVKAFRSNCIGPVSLDIFENEVLTLTGKTGIGKTTMAKVIMRLIDFNSGTLLYKGKCLRTVSMNEFRFKNQIMFQNSLLSVNSLLKMEKIITEPLIVQKYNKAEIKKRLIKYLEMFELSDILLNKYPGELSGGELQRFVFLRALIVEPEFIVLDEPFSNIDTDMALRLIDSIKKIRKAFNPGILIITHSQAYAEILSDRIIKFSKLIPPESL